MANTVEQVKEKLDVADFIKEYVKLSPAGKNLKGLCPFHKEKTPSFIVSPDRQMWHCFGCSKGGDVISFLMQYENLDFTESLRTLAEKVGVQMSHAGAAESRSYTKLYDINTAAAKFFVAHLRTKNDVAETMRKYLYDRGLSDNTITEFGIGFAPVTSDALSSYLSKEGHAIADIERAGLVFKTERGTYWDRFRNRIMFPLHNHIGKVIGFTGRLSPDSQEVNTGKYVNSPETPIFNKSKLLFGYFKSKNEIREAKTAVLVEGQMDAIMLWQAGIKNVVATSGTAITADHLKALRRTADTLTIFYDNDTAGQAATERVIDLASALDFSVRVIHAGIRPDAQDPADIAKDDPKKVVELIEKAEPAMKYYFEQFLHEALEKREAGNVTLLKRGVAQVLAKAAKVASHVEQAHWIRELSILVSIPEESLLEEMKRVGVPTPQSREKEGDEATPQDFTDMFSRKDLIAQRFVGLVMTDTTLAEEATKYKEFLPENYRTIFTEIVEAKKKVGTLPPHLAKLADLISLRSSLEMKEGATPAAEFHDVVGELKHESLKESQGQLEERIKEAESSGDEAKLSEALKEFDRISKENYNT